MHSSHCYHCNTFAFNNTDQTTIYQWHYTRYLGVEYPTLEPIDDSPYSFDTTSELNNTLLSTSALQVYYVLTLTGSLS